MKIIYFDSWDQEATKYTLLVMENSSFLDEYGGQFLVVVLVGSQGTAYFYNRGYVHPSYVKEKHPNLTWRDAEIIAERLNEVIGVR